MKLRALAGALALAGLMAPAFATNGYFSHGYGIKSKGMAGVGIAYGQDALAAATNPANMVLVGSRWDVGLDYFRPQRESTITGAGTFDGNDTENFFIPEFGYNQMISNNMSLGVSVYGNGGMNTDYGNLNSRTFGLIFGTGNLGVDLMQLFIAPTWAMKINDRNAIGVSLKLAYQRFKAYGLQNFDNGMMSSSPGNVTNNGYDSSWGYGIGLGWTGQLTPTFSVGVTYQSRTWMQKFDKYKGLFAEQGDFDIPENYGIGFAWQATPQLTIAADVQRINYGDIKSIANRGSNTAQLGTDNGPGFGWENITAYKLGVSYDLNKQWTLRAGYSWNDVPYAGTETFFNILAPGVIKEHATLGATWRMPNGGELSFAYMHAFKNTVNGTGPSTGINNTMYEDSFGVAYGMKF
ncbi:MAG: outer membrane protein transport protein [Burkholderiales bacterium]|nr:outer membrane protein transport protein [Burkholderiales bacterium]